MCSVIGWNGPFDPSVVGRLLDESRVRGLHAFGFAWPGGFSKHLGYEEFKEDLLTRAPDKFIAHFRYSTSGDWRTAANNQPLVMDDLALAFNGVIHQGTKEEMEQEFGCYLDADNDGYVLMANLFNPSFLKRPDITFAAVYIRNGDVYALRNGKRPLWMYDGSDYRVVASTSDILDRTGLSGKPVPTLKHVLI